MKNKPCPFCGSHKVQRHAYMLNLNKAMPVMLECKQCGASTSFQIGADAFDERKVWAAYNRRAE